MKKNDKNVIILIFVSIIAILIWIFLRPYASKNFTNNIEIPNNITTTNEENESEDQQDTNTQIEDRQIIESLTPTQLNQMMNGDEAISIIDMRSIDMYEHSHIRSSIHYENVAISDIARIVVLVTENGNEDIIMSYYNDLSGTKKVYNLAGGVREWQKMGHPLLSLQNTRSFISSSKINYVEPRELNTLLTQKNDAIMVIDTRRPGNFEKEHIPTAVNIPLTEIEFRYREIPRTGDIFVYGADDDASFQSGILLYDLQFIGVKTIKGGFSAWKEFGYPIVNEN
jgi:rhodanese-related sulfurtransferase